MAGKPFIKIAKLRGFKKESFIRIAIAYFVVFWIMPLLTLIDQSITHISILNWYLLIIVPVSMLILGFAIGTKYGFCPMLIVVTALLVFPSAYVFGFRPAWQYGCFYALVYAAGNFITEVQKTSYRAKGRDKKGD